MNLKYLFFLLIFFAGFSFATNFNTCQTFGVSDTYDLTANIQSNVTCLTVAVAIPTGPTVIDCHGYTIQGGYNNSTTGISMILSDNVTIRNCNIKDFGVNLVATAGNNLLFENNTFDNSSFSNLQLCTTTMCNNLTFFNNTISNGFNNGGEFYGLNNSFILNNTCFLHEHGHGTDRCFHLDKNMYNVEVAYNYMWNNTLGIRSNNINVSNLNIHDNTILNVTIQALNMQASSGTFENFTYANNVMSGANGSIGFDATLPAASTKQTDCAEIHMFGNIVTGGPLWYLNALNSSSVFSNLNLGGLIMCDADNVQIYNLTLMGGMAGRNAIELMHVNNFTLDNYTAFNVYTAIRGLIVNDSTFNNIEVNSCQIGCINFAGGTSSRNNITNSNLYNISANTAISLGGVGNYVSDFYLHDSTSSGWLIGFQPATTAINNTYVRGIIANTPVGLGITNLGSGNTFSDIQTQNVSNVFFVNSTASGTKTITLRNISASGGPSEPPYFRFDLYDSISASEQYIVNLPGQDFTPSSLVDNRSLFRYHVLNFTKIAGSPSIDSVNFTWLDSEMYNGYTEATMESYYYNTTSGGWILLNNTPDTTNNALGQNPLSLGGVYGLFDYVNCPVITVAEPFEQQQNYTGAPNYLGGQFSCIYVNVSDAQINCAGNAINGDGSGGLGIFLATGVSNTVISNCNVNTYFYNIFNQNGQNNSISQSTISNAFSSGIYLDSSSNNVIQNNQFIANGQGIDLVYADQYNTISGNQFVNNTIRGMDVSITSNLNNITLNSFSGNNIDMTFLSSTANYIAENSFSDAGFITWQIVGATSNLFQYNLISNSARAIDIGSTAISNSFSFNNLTSNTEGVLIDSSNNNAFSENLFEGANIGFRTTNSNVSLLNDRFYGNTADLEVISNIATHSINATTILFLPFDGSLANYSNISLYDVQSGSENYQINYGSDIPYEDATHVKFNNKRLTINDINANADFDIFTYNYLTSELNTSEDSVQMYKYNSSLVNLGASQNLVSHSLTKTNLNNAIQVGLYYAPFAIGSCRNLSQSGSYTQEANITATDSCINFLNNSIDLDCSGLIITGPGQGTNTYGINMTTNNSFINNCRIGYFGRAISAEKGNNKTINASFLYNSDIAFFHSSQNTSIVNTSLYSSLSGLWVQSGVISTTNMILYDNFKSLLINATGNGNINSTNSTLGFDSALTTKVGLNLADTIVNLDVYSINMSASPASPPTGNASVRNKYFNLTKIGNANITEIDFLWDESEPVNESNLIVQIYNGSSWLVPSQTLNTTTNRIVMTFQSDSGVYGLFDITGAGAGRNVLIPLANIGAYGLTAYLIYRQLKRSGGRKARIWLFG